MTGRTDTNRFSVFKRRSAFDAGQMVMKATSLIRFVAVILQRIHKRNQCLGNDVLGFKSRKMNLQTVPIIGW